MTRLCGAERAAGAWGMVGRGLWAGIAAEGAPIVFESAGRQASLLELFTSEGCNSCPPHGGLVQPLDGALTSASGSDFVPVAFHVDYWDNLGWLWTGGAAPPVHRAADGLRQILDQRECLYSGVCAEWKGMGRLVPA